MMPQAVASAEDLDRVRLVEFTRRCAKVALDHLKGRAVPGTDAVRRLEKAAETGVLEPEA